MNNAKIFSPKSPLILTEIKSANLFAYLRLSRRPPASVLPVFTSIGDKVAPAFMYQRRNNQDRISEFILDPDLKTEHLTFPESPSHLIANLVHINGLSVYAYEIEDGDIVAAHGEQDFRTQLRCLLQDSRLTRLPFSALEIARFVEDPDEEIKYARQCARSLFRHSEKLALSWSQNTTLSPTARLAALEESSLRTYSIQTNSELDSVTLSSSDWPDVAQKLPQSEDLEQLDLFLPILANIEFDPEENFESAARYALSDAIKTGNTEQKISKFLHLMRVVRDEEILENLYNLIPKAIEELESPVRRVVRFNSFMRRLRNNKKEHSVYKFSMQSTFHSIDLIHAPESRARALLDTIPLIRQNSEQKLALNRVFLTIDSISEPSRRIKLILSLLLLFQRSNYPDRIISYAIDTAFEIQSDIERISALLRLLPYLEDSVARRHATSEIARSLVSIQDESARVNLECRLLPYLGEEERKRHIMLLSDFIGQIRDDVARVSASIVLAHALKPGERGVIVDKAVQETLKLRKREPKCRLLVQLLSLVRNSRMREDLAQTANMLSIRISDERARIQIIAKILPMLSEKQRAQTVGRLLSESFDPALSNEFEHLSRVLRRKNDLNLAELSLKMSIELNMKGLKNETTRALRFVDLGIIYRRKRDIAKAESAFRDALDIFYRSEAQDQVKIAAKLRRALQ